MKLLIAVAVITASLSGYAQTAHKIQNAEPSGVDQYLWSFSKNKSANNAKPLIDFNAIDNWRQMGRFLTVSNDGKYFAYTTNKPTGTLYWFSRPDSLIVQSTTTNWSISFSKVKEGFFSADGQQFIYQNGTDLCFLKTGGVGSKTIKNIASYKTDEHKNWLACLVSDTLILQNLNTGKQQTLTGVSDYEFHATGEWLICKKPSNELLLLNLLTNTQQTLANTVAYTFSANGKAMLTKRVATTGTTLQYVSLPQGNASTIFAIKEKEAVGSYALDEKGFQIVFAVIDSSAANSATIWLCNAGNENAVTKFVVPREQTITGNLSFTDNGRYVQFKLQPNLPPAEKPSENMAGVEVWNYKDTVLQSVQAKSANEVSTYKTIADVETGKIVFQETAGKKIMLLKGDFALVNTDYSEIEGDRFWEHDLHKDSVWLLSLKDGNYRLMSTKNQYRFWFSPDGKWLIYFDPNKGSHYFSFNLLTSKIKDISLNVPADQLLIKDHSDLTEDNAKNANIAAWIDGSPSTLVYDTYDIWKLDFTGRQPAINITGGYGKQHSIVLNLFNSDHYTNEPPLIKSNAPLLLRAFNRESKQNGFYSKANLSAGAPTKLSMGNYFISFMTGSHDINLSNEGVAPLKSEKSNTWIVQRQSTNDAPNYYATTDFKNFRRLTNLQPQAQYSWMTQELHSFKHLDGVTGKGVLYKPENFDSTKRYPVVIAFYGNFSSNMYQFRDATYMVQSMAAGMSPVWLLNNGFLVFTPDIAVTPLKYGPKAFSCIEGAVKYLQRLPYIDGNKLAFAAHSWSAQLGAYLLTHSTSFSAAAITEGLSFGNVINQALSLKKGRSNLSAVETGRDAGSLWENKNEWLDQTTVLNVDKASAALLMLCNKESSEDYQDQAAQLFTAMRRMNKSAWWLKYDNGDHTLQDIKELKDFNIRYAQFLDHYLRNAPAPRWMTEGIPNRFKAIENRYELDPKNSCGRNCLICRAWNKQIVKSPEMFKKEVKEWNLDKNVAEEMKLNENETRKKLDKEGEERTKEVLKMLGK